MVKEAVTSSSQQALGSKKYTHKDWVTTDILEKKNERENRKAVLNNSCTHSEKIGSHAACTEANKMVKKNIRADKRVYLDSLAVEVEEAAHHGNMRTVYAKTKKALWNI